MVPIRAPLGPGNLYPLPALRRRVRLEERPFGGFARGRLSVGCRQCTDGSKMVLFVTGICSFHCFYCPVSDEKMYRAPGSRAETPSTRSNGPAATSAF